ncbi:Cof-type HAD-IIB family hydrolase [Psittacicella gerlachiana]|nr:Cof-type HAD-IIB family hydrolase [Psittacicella gerlachiana]
MEHKHLDLSQIKVVAVDLDGTSINHAHELEDYTAKVYNALPQAGVELIVATGRGKNDVSMLKKLTIPFTLVTYNGSVIAKPETLGYQRPLDPQALVQICNYPYDADLYVSFYTADHWYVNQHNEAYARKLTSSGSAFEFKEATACVNEPVVKVFIVDPTGDRDRLELIKKDLEAKIGDKVEAVFSGNMSLDFTAKGVNKLTAIEAYLQSKGLTASENLIAFGDSMNDYAMLTGAKYGFYMENTLPFIKENFVPHPNCHEIGNCYKLATAKFLNQIFALGIQE